ncbi:hypothetical protein DICPUDRAFT_78031 [Dictyostelium purpureum]|uniref:Uncharacterized protein n=1 Tax=Dictyostelium purpureum TaxID=5786 RepID=F0ZIC7_DICPU|nr:uncharacterized protein DICPUDRAFT_78031 [Dictyostelium purpureum]EGC36303.1 hypothetical protein DICPUDRAFT_78031 [Dictyostelium purpureum]|eukprot:XP_003287181.1 hypothetical protein DICPUDRAFT_78031 [Dictyostelium purpureum]
MDKFLYDPNNNQTNMNNNNNNNNNNNKNSDNDSNLFINNQNESKLVFLINNTNDDPIFSNEFTKKNTLDLDQLLDIDDTEVDTTNVEYLRILEILKGETNSEKNIFNENMDTRDGNLGINKK